MNHKVKRYDPINSDGTCGMCVEDADYGAYVEFADYAALEAARDQLRAEVERLKAQLAEEIQRRFDGNKISSNEHREEVQRLQAQLVQLRAGQKLDELRRACAEILGQDPEVWPSHGNAPLAIASALALAVSTAPQPAPAQDVAGWIPVTERLPEVAQEVIVSTEFEGVCAGILDSYGEWFAPCSEYKLTRVTHWMPLPAAPEVNV